MVATTSILIESACNWQKMLEGQLPAQELDSLQTDNTW